MSRQRAGGECDSDPSSLAGCLRTRPWVAAGLSPSSALSCTFSWFRACYRPHGSSGAVSTGSGSCLPLGDRHRRTGASGHIWSVAVPHRSCPATAPPAPEQETRCVASAAFRSVDIPRGPISSVTPRVAEVGGARRGSAQRAHLHLQREGVQPLAALSSLQLRSGLHGNLAPRQD